MNQGSYYKNLPKKRMGVGALLFNDKEELLIVKPVDKDHWSIPGGVIDQDESPRQAGEREIKEELSLDIKLKEFLCLDYWSTQENKDENLQFIFYGGILTKEQVDSIQLPKDELSEFKFVRPKNAISELGPRLAKRLPHCFKALEQKKSAYLENSKNVL